jgi:hypothetical protein
MIELEQLNERIAQLAELIKAEREVIKSMEISLKAAEEARDRLKEHWKETEPTFKRCGMREQYYIIEFNSYHGFMAVGERDLDLPTDKGQYDNNNYFYTKKRAQEVADKLNFLLKMERLHDIYCPDFLPNWKNSDEVKYSVFYDNYSRIYRTSMFTVNDYKNNAFFATKEIAQKVRDILNAELEREK